MMNQPSTTVTVEQLQQILQALQRLERRFDDFAKVYLAGKFPYGKPTDRWSRGA